MVEDTVNIPRHLRVLREVWSEFLSNLDARIEPVMPIVTDHLDHDNVKRFMKLGQRELDTIKAWLPSLIAWADGPLCQALADPGTTDRRMRRVGKKISGFTDALIKRRTLLRRFSYDPVLRAAAPRLDAIHESLLRQVRTLISDMVHSLGPAALHHPNATRDDGTIDLSFMFVPNVDAEIDRLETWMEVVRTSRNCPC